jgi:trehalose-phosphatase
VARRIEQRHALLLTDFDGTLADIAPTPADAVMADEVRAQIDILGALDSVTLGVVSGRRLADARARVGPAAEFVAGLHGLEIVGPSETFIHPKLAAAPPVIRDLLRAARRELAWCQGLLLEDKTFALTCHVRLAEPHDGDRALEMFAAIAAPHVEQGSLRLLSGAKAYELLPATDWHKGRAVQWIRARVAPYHARPLTVIYLGDDRTDDDAFASLGHDDLAIGVGPRPAADLINWRLAGPASAGRFFAELARLRVGT